jgi:hypothetical protein
MTIITRIAIPPMPMASQSPVRLGSDCDAEVIALATGVAGGPSCQPPSLPVDGNVEGVAEGREPEAMTAATASTSLLDTTAVAGGMVWPADGFDGGMIVVDGGRMVAGRVFSKPLTAKRALAPTPAKGDRARAKDSASRYRASRSRAMALSTTSS